LYFNPIWFDVKRLTIFFFIFIFLGRLNDSPEVMKQMPPLPVKVNEELANSILPRTNLPPQSWIHDKHSYLTRLASWIFLPAPLIRRITAKCQSSWPQDLLLEKKKEWIIVDNHQVELVSIILFYFIFLMLVFLLLFLLLA